MSASTKSIPELEQRTTIQREKLASTMGQLRTNIQPSHLAQEAKETITAKASDVLYGAAEKAKSPRGIGGAAVAALALGAATFFSVRARAKRPPILRQVAVIDSPTGQTHVVEKPIVNKEFMGAATSLAAALTLGAALSKFVPASAKEQELLQGVGEELKEKAMLWARQYVSNLAQPSASGAFSPINAIAVGLGLLMPEKPKL